MLKIKNVSAVIDTTQLLSNITLEIKAGEIHAVLGPKGSGKSGLAQLISGNPNLIQTEGSIHYKNQNLSKLDCDDRFNLGMFASFQYPPEIDGLSNLEFVKLALKAKKDKRQEHDIEKDYNALKTMLGLAPDHGSFFMMADFMEARDFKKNEILQMLMYNPDLIILDDIDQHMTESDITELGLIIKGFFNEHKSMMLITNNHALLDIVVPTHVHILVDGEIKEQGSTDLYKRIIEDGYPQFS